MESCDIMYKTGSWKIFLLGNFRKIVLFSQQVLNIRIHVRFSTGHENNKIIFTLKSLWSRYIFFFFKWFCLSQDFLSIRIFIFFPGRSEKITNHFLMKTCFLHLIHGSVYRCFMYFFLFYENIYENKMRKKEQIYIYFSKIF